ncbi:FAD/NAD(P)-binding protein [Streptomyces formicae]|uniref:FAD/NAD(P)-binding protein n=2 Tax=Streptomyces formicae TaxID=1616117 RepID=A0ABY3WRZ4_9ACTN|nr:FAD/NAD(P)-binding protein [Streptomyces formicae]UNM14875.1 FAD/NAD(P)-binding protein [Streptomyces formicae]
MLRTIRSPHAPHAPHFLGVCTLTVSPAFRHAIALVGAGPRGTSVLERLCASVPELAPEIPLTVHVVDPAPAGPGQVWRTDQPAELLMNTVASQVTLFTDASVRCEGPVRPGPSLYEWAAARSDQNGDGNGGGNGDEDGGGNGDEDGGGGGDEDGLGPDDYPTRACYGRYLEWAFRRIVERAPETVRVVVHRARAVRLDDSNSDSDAVGGVGAGRPDAGAGRLDGMAQHPGDRAQRLVLDDGTVLDGLSAVVLAQGHLPVTEDAHQDRLGEYADRHGLRHFTPANPADLDLSAVAPGETVLLRGLGLNFFDHMALLTTGRGGAFVPDESAPDRLVYRPSGREPRLYAGSRRGVPYQARGDNEKGASGRHHPLLLTADVIAAFRKRADAGDPPDFLDEIWPLVAKEVETVYYEALLTPAAQGSPPPGFRARFLDAPHGSPEEAAVLDAYGCAAGDRWSWERVSYPHRGGEFTGPAAFRGWLVDHLRRDAGHAALGNVAGPVKAALDVLRDVRNEVRQIVDHAGLSGASRRDHLDRWYTPLNAFLSIGPPRRRIQEMAALIEAGVLEVVGPRMSVRAEGGRFTAESPDVPGSVVAATTLIEARLPEPDLRRSRDELLARLLRTGQCRPHVVDGYETGGLDVTERPYCLIDRQGRAHPRRFAFGVPTEGVHWVTAAGARPGVDSVTLSDADAVARAALAITARCELLMKNDRRPNVELASID